MRYPKIGIKLGEMLGEGSQGSVFKALRIDAASGLTQTVALKILHSRTAVELWRREFESLARVRSPYCVQVFAFERYRRRPALVLEYVEGLSLMELVCTLDLEQSVEILAQTEAGLMDLREQGLFHGDLNPGNVLVDVTGRVRLLDFGLANSDGRLTPDFASPERLSGASADFASDLFSLGKIECFLAGASALDSTGVDYLHPNERLRRPRGIAPCSLRRTLLAQKVQSTLTRRQRLRELTTCSLAPVLVPKRKSHLKIASLLLAMTMVSASSAQPRFARFQILSFRTQNWLYLSVNGSPLGYSPVSLPIEAGKTYKIEWRSARASGTKLVEVSDHRDLFLTDRDFSH